MDAEKNHDGRAAAPAFEPVDSTLDAVRLMMEAETRHQTVHGHAERTADVQDASGRGKSEMDDPDNSRSARRRRRRGKAALPEIAPADAVDAGGTRGAIYAESIQDTSEGVLGDLTEGFSEERPGPSRSRPRLRPRSRRGPLMWLVGRLRAKRRTGDAEATEADWGDTDPILSYKEGGLDEVEVQMFAPEIEERPSRDHRLANGVEVARSTFRPAARPAATPEGHRREVYHAESGEVAEEHEGLFARFAARVRSYQPKFRHSIMIAILAVMVWNPWLLPGIVFVMIWVALIAHLTVGPDRMGEIITALREKAAARFPEKAAEVHRRAEIGAERLERLIARLPGRWKDKIQLPDFSGQSDVLFEGDDPFTRLATRRHDQRGAGTPAE